ncbi:unnamed protein product [Penicillium salamii]|uniref:Histone-lysine N-methyltransferase SET5 n=1 Tax=Penicillium salamii TaxID=1612424 RepID=A0A9W4I832_9EURO|nr:unnamed protein product [Penicillium salamii]CAG8263645.1 unnamed protein product [Penicillium salamii]CAG8377324.1 unnamed protein product [Penicillium salamii]CAG8426302.1 unnamed protein product [Penicillium salamii]
MASPMPSPAAPRLAEVYDTFADIDIINAPQYPKGPNIHTQVQLGDKLTEDNALLARRLWEGPDTHLGDAWKAKTNRPYPRDENEPTIMHVLAHNVYEHLMSSPFLPVSREAAIANWRTENLDVTYDGIQGLNALRDNIFVNGVSPLSARQEHWTIPKLKQELNARKVPFDDKSKKAALQTLLFEFELDQKVGALKRTKLSHWGINRAHTHIVAPARNAALSALDMYTAAISLSPYNPTYWTSRAYCHYLQGFFDLAIGDAYRAQLLCEVLTLALKRNLRPGLYTRVWDAIQMHLMAGWKSGSNAPPEILQMRRANGINYFIPTLRSAFDNIICLSLAAMNCWDDFNIYMEEHLRRGLLAQREADTPIQRKKAVQCIINEINERRTQPSAGRQPLYGHEWMRGWVSGGTRYPYEPTDVNREAAPFLATLNRNVFTVSAHATVDKGLCEVRPKILSDNTSNGLGVFATTKIAAGTVIHYEEPVIRGHLQPNILADGQTSAAHTISRCDNCKQPIPKEQLKHIIDNLELIRNPEKDTAGSHPLPCPCLNLINPLKDDLRNDGQPPAQFCADNQRKDAAGNAMPCRQIASEIYAFSEFKDIKWDWLHNAMRANITRHANRDHFSAHHEKHGTVLSLLLKSVLEITLHRRHRDPDIQPHEIDELLILENGADSNQPWTDSWFPFTMSGNIRVPFDILSALGIDIFRDLAFDTWSLQIVLRKLLINAVPWDLARRAKQDMYTKHDGLKNVPRGNEQVKMKKGKEDFAWLEPSLSDLYLFPGLSMFNHACRLSENATWGFHSTVLNRVVVYATKAIAADEEIRIPYVNLDFPGARGGANVGEAVRLFGKNCDCEGCAGAAAGDGAAVAMKGAPDPAPGPAAPPGLGGLLFAGTGFPPRAEFQPGASPVLGAGPRPVFGAGASPAARGMLNRGGDGMAGEVASSDEEMEDYETKESPGLG